MTTMESYDDHPGKYSTTATNTVTETERILSKLGHGYKRAKAQQILRLLKDQECLNQRFKDCALEEDDDCENENSSNIHGSQRRSNDDERRFSQIASRKPQESTKRLSNSVDPERCRTSMGFYNEAEFSAPLETGDSDEDQHQLDNLGADDDMDVSFDTRDILMNKLAAGGRQENARQQLQQHRTMLRLQMDEDCENVVVVEERQAPSASRSSRPKTGVASGSSKGKQYRRPSKTSSNHVQTKTNSSSTTTVTRFDPPFTPRGGVRGFCDGQATPREDAIPCITPRQNDFKICLSPRKNEVDFCYTPRGNPISNPTYQRHNQLQNDLSGFYSSRYNDMPSSTRHQDNTGGGFYTPRQMKHEAGGAGRREDINPAMATPRGHLLHKAVRDGFSTPRAEPTTPCSTPRGDNQNGGLTPRFQNNRVTLGGYSSMNNQPKAGRITEKNLFDVSPSTFASDPPAGRPRRTNLVTKSIALAEQAKLAAASSPRGGHHTPRGTVLSVDQNPTHAMQVGGLQEGEVTTPRRSKGTSQKPRGNGDLQRMGVHQNLNKLSEMVQPITVMKLPPLDSSMNKPVITQGI